MKAVLAMPCPSCVLRMHFIYLCAFDMMTCRGTGPTEDVWSSGRDLNPKVYKSLFAHVCAIFKKSLASGN